MRKYLTFFLLTTAVSFCEAQQLELKKGTLLNFAVSDLKTVYDYYVTITAIDSNHVSFDWKKVSGNSKKGSAEITSASLDSATTLLFAIDGIKKLTLPGITLFLSRQQFQKLKKGKCNLGSDASMRGIPIETVSNGPDEIMVNNNPMVIQQVFGTGEANTGKIWVLDNEVFPLVIGYKGPTLTYTLMNVSNPE
ncbi:MAG: hypothetical protein V4615_09550 [Bacteroidota bacterium]